MKSKISNQSPNIYTCITFVLLVVFGYSGFANNLYSTPPTSPSELIGSSIVPGASVYVIDQEIGTSNMLTINPKTSITLSVDSNQPTDWFIYQVKLKVVPLLSTGVPGNAYPLTLSVTYSPDGNVGNYADLMKHELAGSYGADVYVLDIATEDPDTGAITAITPDNVSLKLDFSSEQYYELSSSISIPGHTFLSNTSSLNIQWSPVIGAKEYELEWTWIDNYGALNTLGLPTELPASAIDLTVRDYELNSTRVQVTANENASQSNRYEIPLIYSRGWLIYRVRAVGRFLDDISDLTVPFYGSWSSGNNNEIKVGNWPHKYQITTSHENEKNWQFQASYAEEGKKKEVVSYFDGSLRNRQTVTKINSDNDGLGNAIVGEVIYDIQGRPAIEVLPVPTGNNKIGYYTDFNINLDTNTYTHYDFDWDTSEEENCAVAVEGMSTKSGSSKYYSSNNIIQNNFQDYVPDANLFPFSQVEYTPDNTGRIRRKSGLGEEHQLGSKNEMKYFYSQPTTSFELNRLFGYEVGKLNHYKKNVIVDPNNQTSVSYLDPQGRIIATALAGGNPKKGEQDILTGLPDEDNDELHQIISANLLESNELYVTGRFQLLEDGYQIGKQLTVIQNNSDYEFSYAFDSNGQFTFSEECPVAFPYKYDLKIAVVNDCGEEMLNEGTVALTEIENYNVTDPLTATLDVGEYSLIKDLIVNENVIEEYWIEFLANAGENCLLTIEDFQLITFDCSMIDCEIVSQGKASYVKSKLEANYPDVSFSISGDTVIFSTTGLEADVIAEIEAFTNGLEESFPIVQEFCEVKSMCFINEQTLLADVSPLGQYGDITFTLDTTGASEGIIEDGLSVFNDANVIYYNQDGSVTNNDWRHPVTPYLDTDGTSSVITVINQNGTSSTDDAIWSPEIIDTATPLLNATTGVFTIKPEQLANVSDFVTAWKSSWANSLVPYHPEYCYLEYTEEVCTKENRVGGVAMNTYQYNDFLSEITTYTEAIQNGLFGSSFTDIMDDDPLFNFEFASETDTALIDYAEMRRAIMQHALEVNYGGLGDDITPAIFNLTSFSLAVVEFGSLMNTTNIQTLPQNSNGLYSLINSLSTEEKDEVWTQYVNNYIGLRSKIYDVFLSLHAVKEGCYNNCLDGDIIDQDVLVIAGDDYDIDVTNNSSGSFIGPISSYLNVSYGTSTIGQVLQSATVSPTNTLCPNGNYNEKIKRFPGSTFLVSQEIIDGDIDGLENTTDIDYYNQTGKCKIQMEVQVFLNGFFGERVNSNQVDDNLIYDNTYLSINLFEKLGGVDGETPSIQGQVSGNQLTFAMNGISNIQCTSPITLRSPQGLSWNSYGSSWEFVDNYMGLTQMYHDETIEDDNIDSFELLGTVLINGETREYIFTGTTCVVLDDCKCSAEDNAPIPIDPTIECLTNPEIDCDSIDGEYCVYSPITNGNLIDCKCNSDFSLANESNLVSNVNADYSALNNQSSTTLKSVVNSILGSSPLSNVSYDMPASWDNSVLPSLFYTFYKNKLLEEGLTAAGDLTFTNFLNATYTILPANNNSTLQFLFGSGVRYTMKFTWNIRSSRTCDITPLDYNECTGYNEDGSTYTYNCCPAGTSTINGGCCPTENTTVTQGSNGSLDLVNDNVSITSNSIRIFNGKTYRNYTQTIGANTSLSNIDYYRTSNRFYINGSSNFSPGAKLCLTASTNLESYRVKNFESNVCERVSHLVIVTDESGSFKDERTNMRQALNNFISTIQDGDIYLTFLTMGPQGESTIPELGQSVIQSGNTFVITDVPLLYEHIDSFTTTPDNDPIETWISKYGQRNIASGGAVDIDGNPIVLDADNWNSAFKYIDEKIIQDVDIPSPDAVLVFADNRPGSGEIIPLIRAEKIRKEEKAKVYYYVNGIASDFNFKSIAYTHDLLRVSNTGTDMDVTDIYYANNFDDLQVQISSLGINLANSGIICTDVICSSCVVQTVRPVSCNEKWEVFNDYFNFQEVTYTNDDSSPANGDPVSYTVIEAQSGIPGLQIPNTFNEAYFCGANFAYITDNYLYYLDEIRTIYGVTTTDHPLFLSIGTFGNTDLNYGFDDSETTVMDMHTVIDDYLISITLDTNQEPSVTWNDFVNGNEGSTPEIIGWIELNSPCLPAPMVPQIPVSIQVPESECDEIISTIANAYAQDSYLTYLEQLKAQFTEAYVNGAIGNAQESFTMQYPDKEYQYTLYYYDQAGNLIQTIPPEGVHRLGDDLNTQEKVVLNNKINTDITNNTTVTELPVHDMQTNYRYNSLNQLVWQKTPDGGETRFAYDALGRVIASQNAKQAELYAPVTNGPRPIPYIRFSYINYDQLGRINETGEIHIFVTQVYTINDEGKLLRNNVTQSNFDNAPFNSYFKKEVTRTYYDKMILGKESLFETYSYNDRNRVTAILYYDKISGDARPSYENGLYYNYDIHGNVDEMVTEINDQDLVSLGHNIKKVQYDYDLISGNVNVVTYQKNKKDQFIHKYAYDADNRITSVQTSRDNRIWEIDANYEYYEHGPLARVLIGDKEVQGVDYVYTLQGWLKGVNADVLDPRKDIAQDAQINKVGRDAFAYSLSYFNKDYKPRNSDIHPFAKSEIAYETSIGLKNGNIRGMTTALMNTDEKELNIAYNLYEYDQLNRIKGMKNREGSSTGEGSFIPGLVTSYDYDRNGNLQELGRTGFLKNGAIETMDKLVYKYYSDSDGKPTNRLQIVHDNAGNSDLFDLDLEDHKEDYVYDKIGQLTQDIDENIKKIDWRIDGKVASILKTNGLKIDFGYDGTGNRLYKRVLSGDRVAKENTTYYLRDAQGNVLSVYNMVDARDGDGSPSVLEYDVFLENATITTDEGETLAQNDIFVAGGLNIYTTEPTNGKKVLTAGHKVTLKPGFRAKSGSHFLAKIEDVKPPSDLTLDLAEQHIYGISRLGLQEPSTSLLANIAGRETTNTRNNFIRVVGDKRYELSNHLGNVLSVITDRKLLDIDRNIFKPDVITHNDYYPFGMLLPNRYGNSNNYRYGFGGMEKDDEVKGEGNHIAYAERGYDPRVGRWISMDAYAPLFAGHSPYNYALNNPIYIVDQEGNWPKPSELMPDDTSPMLKGIVDGIWEGLTGTAGFAWDYATDSEFRNGVNEGFKALVSDPIGTLSGIVEEYAGMLERLATGNGTDEDYYNVGMEIGEGSVGLILGGSTLVAKVSKKLLKKTPKSGMAKKTKMKFDCISCFTGDTPVLTDNGYVAIEDVQAGDKVWYFNQKDQKLIKRTINDKKEKSVDEVIEIELKGGRRIKVPFNFTVLVGDTERAAVDLVSGDEVTLYNGKVIEVVSIKILKGSFTFYDLEMDSE